MCGINITILGVCMVSHSASFLLAGFEGFWGKLQHSVITENSPRSTNIKCHPLIITVWPSPSLPPPPPQLILLEHQHVICASPGTKSVTALNHSVAIVSSGLSAVLTPKTGAPAMQLRIICHLRHRNHHPYPLHTCKYLILTMTASTLRYLTILYVL